ncbi:hypothetical protein HCN44_006422 [Aphidius gifuensis]|uniref:CHK kinase-like domain-containing protein n=1 Tax=Aphidius gifuensis TaxID=684658 RepID=A0A835CWC7_APHGI|nr:uncharacterized protein LOC122850271 [Aphidius gifuensis]KAF7995315.1 hypothetical protein HCN44_006422 [Aphidius gifuensis]
MDETRVVHNKKLELEYIRYLFEQQVEKDKSYEKIEIIGIDEEPGSGRGDNYTSMLYRLGINGRKCCDGKWIPWHTSIIYKVLPESKARREAFKSELLFRNEVAFYNHVWPVLEKLQNINNNNNNNNNNNIIFNGIPKIYVAKSDLIVMEDLREKGYIMADRRKGLELDKLKLVLKALAGFHALSLTLADTRPDIFNKLADENNSQGIRETLFRIENEEWYRNYYRVAAKNAINMVTETLSASQIYQQDIIDKLQKFLHEDVFFRTMCELASTRGSLTVFCHGDCWTNNFLFSSNKSINENDENNKKQQAVYLVDFQLMRVGSVALDLTNLLYCCTSRQVRKNHMTSLLLYYHSHLMDALKILNPNNTSRDSSTTWQLLNDEIRKCGRFGLGIALDILPCSTCDSDNAPDLYENASSSGGGGGDAITDSNEENKNTDAPLPIIGGIECAKMMTDLVLELIHNNAL